MNYFKLWPFIAIALIPIAYFLGTFQGARDKQIEMENAHIIASAKNDVKTVNEIIKVKTEYKPLYIEVEKPYEIPKCPAPVILIDIIDRLPDGEAIN